MRGRRAWLWALAPLILWWAGRDMAPSLGEAGWGSFTAVVGGERGLLSPAWDLLPTVGAGLWESVQMALAGTALAGLFALVLGALASRTLSGGVVSTAVKGILNAIRTLPELLLAVIFMVGVGPGAFAGVLALGFHSIGTVGKLTAEILESLDPRPMEAVTAVGGSRLAVFRWAAWPRVLPEFLSVLLYRFEINVRAASVLGMVGAGGIGKTLAFAINARSWDRVGAILVGIILVVAVVDAVSARLRAKLV